MTNSVLYIHEGFENPGDCFSYSGARHYINKIGVVYEQSVCLKTTSDIPSLLGVSGPDYLVFAGAPWLWDQCTKSTKYIAAYALLNMARGVKKLAIGVGSCFLAQHCDYALADFIRNERQALIDFWSHFDAIIVRDILAWKIFESIGISATLAPCPSIAASEWFGRSSLAEGELVLAEDLEHNFMFDFMRPDDFNYYKQRLDASKDRNGKEILWVGNNRVGGHARSLRSICEEIKSANCRNFFTARVHAALVASSLGLDGELMVLDSRALSAEIHGIKLCGPQAASLLSVAEKLRQAAPAPQKIADAIAQALDTPTPSCLATYTRMNAVSTQDIVGTTRFFRNRLQHQTVIKHVGTGSDQKALIVGASRGNEAYSFAIECELAGKRFAIDAIDIDKNNIAHARARIYHANDFVDFDGTSLLTDDVRTYFTATESRFVVDTEKLASSIAFEQQDLFNCKGAYDVIVCNNVLIHFSDAFAAKAIEKLISCLAPGGVIAFGGCDQTVLENTVKAIPDIVPVTDNVTAIWDSWKGDRLSWDTDPTLYVAMPPIDKNIADWEKTYSTIFLRPAPPSSSA